MGSDRQLLLQKRASRQKKGFDIVRWESAEFHDIFLLLSFTDLIHSEVKKLKGRAHVSEAEMTD